MLLAVALAGCDQAGGDATQVAAKVNDKEVSLRQLEHLVQRQPPAPPGRADALARRALETLIDQELMAQQARTLGLDQDPRVVQAMEAAKREVLVKAYQDSLAERASLPSSDEIDRYYESQPALFSQRRFYTIQEIGVEGSVEQMVALQPRVESAADANRVAEIFREAGRRISTRQLSVSPEDVPLALLERLSQLKNGQSLMVPQSGGARVLTLLESQSAPLSREAAQRPIQAFLTNERKRQAVQVGMKAARDAARIEYKGKFAQAAESPASGASAATP